MNTMASPILVHDKQFEPFLSKDVLSARIKELAAQLNKDFQGKRPLFIAILNEIGRAHV